MITSKSIINRLSQYKTALARLETLGFVKVFSENLAETVGVSSAQVRKDFSLFGISGNKRGGYVIEALIGQLNAILGKDQIQKVAVVGTGNIGAALMKYRGFEKDGIKITAGFDLDPAKVRKSSEVPILPLSELKDYVIENKIRIAIIAVPDVAAQQTMDLLVAAGIKGVLNFAPIRLKSPEEIIVNNVNLGTELENLIYFVNVQRKSRKADSQTNKETKE